MVSQRFPSERRIRRRTEFQRVFDGAQRAHGRFFTVLTLPGASGRSRLGIVASRKIGDAVRRNRAKRLIRETFRRSTAVTAHAADIVVIPRRELFDAPYAILESDFHATLKRCRSRSVSDARRR